MHKLLPLKGSSLSEFYCYVNFSLFWKKYRYSQQCNLFYYFCTMILCVYIKGISKQNLQKWISVLLNSHIQFAFFCTRTCCRTWLTNWIYLKTFQHMQQLITVFINRVNKKVLVSANVVVFFSKLKKTTKADVLINIQFSKYNCA